MGASLCATHIGAEHLVGLSGDAYRYRLCAGTVELTTVICVICIMTKMAFHLFAGALVLQGLLGWDVMPVIVLAGIVIAAITLIGGFTAAAYTDSIQTGIMILGCGLMVLIGLHKAGGVGGSCGGGPGRHQNRQVPR